MEKKYIDCYWFLIIVAFGKKREWFLEKANNSSLSFKGMFSFFVLPKSEKEVVDFLLPNKFLFLATNYFKSPSFESACIEKASQRKMPLKYIEYFLPLFEFIEDVAYEYDFIFYELEENLFLRFINTHTNEVISRHVIHRKNAHELEKVIKDFKHAPIKMSVRAFDDFQKELKRKFLKDFEVDLRNYSIFLENLSDNNCDVWLQNNKTGKKILIRSVRYNERTGSISFAGQQEGVMTL